MASKQINNRFYAGLTGLNFPSVSPGLHSSLRDFAPAWAMKLRLYEPNAKSSKWWYLNSYKKTNFAAYAACSYNCSTV